MYDVVWDSVAGCWFARHINCRHPGGNVPAATLPSYAEACQVARGGHPTITIPSHFDRFGADTRQTVTWFAVAERAVHEGFVTCKYGGDWTYQQITGTHGVVLYEGFSENEARSALDAFLVCRTVSAGTYCFAHNPGVMT